MVCRFTLCLIVCVAIPTFALSEELQRLPESTLHFRRPVAICALDDDRAAVANSRSGTLSLVDLQEHKIVAEYKLGGQPTDLAIVSDTLLVTDSEKGRLLALKFNHDRAVIVWQLSVPAHPVSLSVSADGKWCTVCSLWSRRVTFVHLPTKGGANKPKILASVALPFAPREQLLLQEKGHLLVADGFGGRLAAIDVQKHAVTAVHRFPGQNIRGLALTTDNQGVFVSHQLLNELSPPRRSEVIWGVMMSDALRVIQVKHLLDPQAEIMDDSRFIMVGNGTTGAGDPEALIPRDDDRVVILHGGTNEVTIIEPDNLTMLRIPIGRRPVAIETVGKDQYLITNQLSDSLTFLNLAAQPDYDRKPPYKSKPKSNRTKPYSETHATNAYSSSGGYSQPYKRGEVLTDGRERFLTGYADRKIGIRHISLGKQPATGPAERGEAHFFNARLSLGNWYSCHSCHTDGHTTGGRADTLGDGNEGAPKRILSLGGVHETGPWSWIGRKRQLSEQVEQSLQLTMRNHALSPKDIGDMVEFLKTLEPPPPFQPATSNADAAFIKRGRQLFESLDCRSCHNSATLTSEDAYDVGLTDALGTKEFNPPSLRGVGHRPHLFHDNRADSVDEVIRKFRHQLPRDLSESEKQTLIRYLKSL